MSVPVVWKVLKPPKPLREMLANTRTAIGWGPPEIVPGCLVHLRWDEPDEKYSGPGLPPTIRRDVIKLVGHMNANGGTCDCHFEGAWVVAYSTSLIEILKDADYLTAQAKTIAAIAVSMEEES